MEAVIDFVKGLRLGDKLSPFRNPSIMWFYVFLPSFIAYMMLLSDYLNAKPLIGSIEVLDPSFNKLIYPGYSMEVISDGFIWTEGPLWMKDEAASLSYLMFSDTRQNRVYKWEEGKGFFTVGKSIYTEKSGCSNRWEDCLLADEPGSNGLLRKDRYKLESLEFFACQHGERAISLFKENGTRIPIATHYKGMRLNSPNDLVYSPEGHLYFTDPRYGLYNTDRVIVNQELNHSGVYFIHSEHLKEAIRTGEPTTEVLLLDASMEWPNGLAFSPDFTKLYVSNSGKNDPYWKVYDVGDYGTLKGGQVFINATSLLQEECLRMGASIDCQADSIGAPDGFKVDINGNIFASGPGGVLVFSPEGKLIGRFRLDMPVSNVAFGEDGRLYITASDKVIRVWIKTKPTKLI